MNTPLDLNSVLFAQLERLSATDLKGEELQAELQKADAIEKISEQVIKNNNMRLSAAKLVAEYRGLKNADSVEIPQNLIG
ncbi:hypothetical protein J0904_05595 [Acinetobacter bereziniae]|jgi:hypothetical protein|uniref:Uncharacterized protein n=1 Tax=Acinetobacter bereziniae TaxID=106648 RepID=A0A8I1DJB2_ACIBZ|nr:MULTISPECIES: hypothetical protein [Acinetobacter]KKW80406.1 hypothetical protein AAV97_05160 [Acinetobacter sp. Ag2]MBJ8452990.1 hypothetical protein [Acinetobacter bereziniae]MBJ8457095.1 hypothetical protein [Acinetobacter bereziniae]MBO3655947.1 hypothetical protein [Acinetobacter bereziniae]MCM8511561.1 hypothetical protein [Acinetobacter bereziniae]